MKLRTLGLAALISTLALTGCGTTDAPAGDPTAATGDPVSITDARGTPVFLDAPAQKVVTLEWSVTEYAVSLGVDPVGVADPKGYGVWSARVPLSGDPVDVGMRTEPSIDAIADLAPDLILADTSSIPEEAMKQMERIAPVAVFNSATADGLFDLVKKNQHDVATLLGKEAEADELDADFDAALQKAKESVEEAGKTGDPMVFAYPYNEANSMTFRLHGPGSASSEVGRAIGLTDASTEQGDEAYGLTTTDVEGLRTLPDDTHFLYWVDADEGDPMETLKKNAVWTGLPFVTADRVAPAGTGIWLYGGTTSLGAFADEVAGIVAEQ
ncbi:ABC transporter substrate-binding protein [Brevibacterium luteolum]|uniref:ABC transporter substrate-binding protein n=1 Tax=Brevibacterium luteolum TaxID=199591 RepID=UPI00223AC52F|nr:iron-siderophore ABC transporter substrate-binding protein [Brevibacterium luteolum]MCT1828857.1 iron-siderophore ABC transporter substrate-binding protein [Brevibacterium luteolum]